MHKDQEKQEIPFEELIETAADLALQNGQAIMPLDAKQLNVSGRPQYYNADVDRLTADLIYYDHDDEGPSRYYHRRLADAVVAYLSEFVRYRRGLAAVELVERWNRKDGSRFERLVFHRRSTFKPPRWLQSHAETAPPDTIFYFGTTLKDSPQESVASF